MMMMMMIIIIIIIIIIVIGKLCLDRFIVTFLIGS